MSVSFLDHIRDLEDPRIPGMVLYRLDEVLVTVLVGLICRAEDFDEIEDVCAELLDWLRRLLPFEHGIAPAQTLRRTLARLDPRRLEEAFAAWTGSLAERVRGVVAVDGKSVRGSKQDITGKGALHLVSAYAHEAELILAQRAVDAKAMRSPPSPISWRCWRSRGRSSPSTRWERRRTSPRRSSPGRPITSWRSKAIRRLHDDAAQFFANLALAADCPRHEETASGHGRIEERTVRVADADWLAERHCQWEGLASIASVTVRRTLKNTGATSTETRFYISSLPPDPARLAAAVRAHWSVENNLHWVLDVAFREDECRTRKDLAARNLAMIRRAALNMLRRDTSRLSLKRKRLKAAMNTDFRNAILAC